MPDYGGIGRGIESVGASIARGIRDRQEANEKRRKEKALYEATKAGVPRELAVPGIESGKPSSAIISEWREQQQREGTAKAVAIGGAIAPQLESAQNLALMESRGLGGPERDANIMQAAGLTTRSPREVYGAAESQTGTLEAQKKQGEQESAGRRLQSMIDQGIKPKYSDYLAAGMTATSAIEAVRLPKISEGEIERQHKRANRAQLWKAIKAPDTPEWQYWIQEGGERPGKQAADFPTAAQKAADFEPEQRRLTEEQTPAGIVQREREQPPADTTSAGKLKPLTVLTPDQVRDSALALTRSMSQMKQEAAGVDVPDAQGEGLQQQIEAVRQEIELLTEIRDHLKGKP